MSTSLLYHALQIHGYDYHHEVTCFEKRKRYVMKHNKAVTTVLLCLIILIFPVTSFAQEQERESRKETLTIEEAMQSEKDEFGVPTSLYQLDSQLLKYMEEIVTRRNFYKRHGSKIFTYGAVSAGLGLLILALSDGTEYGYFGVIGRVTDYTLAGVITALGVGFGIYGLEVQSRSVSSTELMNYFREQYEPRSISINLRIKF